MGDFCFLDRIAQISKGESLTAYFTLKGSEEFLQDHFAGFPVMPGVLMIESLRQAASALLACSGDFQEPFSRLAKIENVKFGQFLKPGCLLKLSVKCCGKEGALSLFEGQIHRVDPEAGESRALSASFALKPIEGEAPVKRALEVNSREWHGALI